MTAWNLENPLLTSRKSDNDSNYYSKSSSYSSSYQKTSINGQDQESSSYNEHHYDSRDGDSYSKGINNFNQDFGSKKSSLAANGSSTEMERRLERQRRESSRKSSGPMPLWLSPADEEEAGQASVLRRSSQSSKKSISKVYIA